MLPITLYDLREYLTADGVSPFAKWRSMLDRPTRARIERVLERIANGNFGDHKGVGEGVMETRIHTGPGYRVYYARDGEMLILLLAGGTKQSQSKDIQYAKERWCDYKGRKRTGA